MATNTKICDIDPDVKEKLRKFRFRKEKTNAAIVLKIDQERMMIIEDESYDDITPDDLVEELPEHLPRYIVYSYVYKHDDGRVSYPLCLIHCVPSGCTNRSIQMMYAGSRNFLVKEAELTKVFEVRDPTEITEEWLEAKLAFFR